MTEAALREPWPSLSQQREASTFGIWIFLASEILFFAGMFLCYADARATQPGFLTASGKTDLMFGSANTLILLTSSFTMAVASQGADAKLRRLTTWGLAATAALGVAFIIVKGLEYCEDIQNHFVPGPLFSIHGRGAQLFFALYWVMTGVHAIHLTIGIALVARLVLAISRRKMDLASPEIRVIALYWALVDVIWLVLYALLYLGGRS
jgi:cytochrome c oxidase subunit III